MQSLSTIRSSLTQLQNTTDDEVGDMILGIMELVDDLEYEMKQKTLDDDDRSEIIEHLETIHEESQAIHDFLHSHEQEISDYGWPRPNPLTKATESEVISEAQIQALEGDESDAEAFIKALGSGEYAEYVPVNGHTFITPCDHNDFDFVVEPNADIDHAGDLLDHIEAEIQSELDLNVRSQMCNNEEGTVLVGIAGDHQLIQ